MKLINLIKRELSKYIDPVYRDGEKRFFKEPIKNLGVRVPQRRKIAAEFWPEVKKLNQRELYYLAEKMFKDEYGELTTIANSFLWRRREMFKSKDFIIFKRWIDKYFDNWAKIDDFCTHSLGYLINRFPQLTPQLLPWTKSKNRWVKRAAAVSLIYPWGQTKKYLPQIIKTARVLLEDPDDMVQKGYGWMLKEASVHNQKEVFELVMKHKARMPRTALRYAIEKMPQELKKQAMQKT